VLVEFKTLKILYRYIFLMLGSPLFVCLVLFIGIGGNINDMILGVVNEEASSIDECRNASLNNYDVQLFQSDCTFQRVSCLFLAELDENVAKLVSSLKLFVEEKIQTLQTSAEILQKHRRSAQ
jgi:hypothetical protein